MATTAQVKTDMDTVATHLTDGSLTAALINADDPSGLITSCLTLAEQLQNMLADAGLGNRYQKSSRKA
jgi:hypothetical protein